jgi:hypothetical protein
MSEKGARTGDDAPVEAESLLDEVWDAGREGAGWCRFVTLRYSPPSVPHYSLRCFQTPGLQEPGPFIIGILKPTHIELVLTIAR